MATMNSPKKLKLAAKPRPRYKNDPFLKTLGEHCRRLRKQRGYSIDRLSKESEQLSTASIDRLEKGLADTQILVLVRYADTLGLTLIDLFSFLKKPNIANDSRILPYEEGFKPPQGFVPVYPIKVAAGQFGHKVENRMSPLGWADCGIKGTATDYFATFVSGDSVQPRINDGDLCLFKVYSGGSRQGKIFLIQALGLNDSETGESFVVKKYIRQTPKNIKSEDQTIVHLVSDNPKFSPIVLMGASDEDVQTIAEFIKVIVKI